MWKAHRYVLQHLLCMNKHRFMKSHLFVAGQCHCSCPVSCSLGWYNMASSQRSQLTWWQITGGIWKQLGAHFETWAQIMTTYQMYVWGDGAQYTESGESMMVFSCGIVIDPKRTNIFPLFLCREVTWHDQRQKVVNLFLLDEGYGYLKIDLVLIMHWSSKSIQYSMCLPLEGTVSWWCNHVCLPGPSPLAACLLNQKLVIWWVPGHILGT